MGPEQLPKGNAKFKLRGPRVEEWIAGENEQAHVHVGGTGTESVPILPSRFCPFGTACPYSVVRLSLFCPDRTGTESGQGQNRDKDRIGTGM